jgi:hypothetical protein
MVYTDTDGNFKLLAPAGNISLLLYYIVYGIDGPKEYHIKEIPFNGTADFAPISEEEATRRVDWNRTLNISIDPANLEGIIFDDRNGNGSYDAGIDAPLKDIQVILEDNVHGNSYLAITDERGLYNFTGLFPSVYTLTAKENEIEMHKNSTLLLLPENNTYNISKPKPSTIEGKAYIDGNNDGRYNEGEGIGNVNLKLIYSDIEVVNTTSTENGDYAFINLLPGKYTINATLINETTGYPAYRKIETIDVEENRTISLNISLELVEIGVSGYTLYNGTPIGDVDIKFLPADIENNTARFSSTSSNSTTGYYSIKLLPGIYNISASLEIPQDNKTIKYSYTGNLTITIGQTPITNFNITLVRKD